MAVTNEMNLPMVSVAPTAMAAGSLSMASPEMTAALASVPAVEPQGTDYATDDSIVVGSPDSSFDPASITVYANTITPVSYSADQTAVASFDVVFSVGVNCDGVSKTYQVVKRIGIDKCKLASEAACSTPVSVVENNTAAKADAEATKKRFRRLAGLE